MNSPEHDPLVSRSAKEENFTQHTDHLAKMIERNTRDNHQRETAVYGLNLFRQDYPTEPNSYMFTPHLCLVAQGSKSIMLGDEVYIYEPLSYVITSVDLPLASYIIRATPEHPYLGLTLELDMQEISDWIKKHYDEPFSVKELAKQAGMSPSGFHEHFRNLTNHTPLQFQKRIRLHEARRLMLAENLDAGNAGFRVGYESPTQFNREYKRMFGNPPRTDIKKLQAT